MRCNSLFNYSRHNLKTFYFCRMLKSAGGGFILLFLLSLISILQMSCANIGMPTGGPRDSIAPALSKATPEQWAVNFSGNKVVLSFNEYIEAANFSNELIVSPQLKYNPQIVVGLRDITVRFRDTLRPNTTYTLQFGNSIKDVNEGNIVRNFIYTFSTGPQIDSLRIRGKASLAETGATDSTLIAMLYANLADSAVKTQKPDYIARIGADGNFEFMNLPDGDYKMYVLKDGNGDKRYDSPFELFGFLPGNRTVKPGETGSMEIKVYAAEKELPKPPASSGSGKKNTKLNFTFSPSPALVDLTKSFVIVADKPLTVFDSGKIQLTDTNYVKIPGSFIRLDTTLTRVEVHNNWKQEEKYYLLVDSSFAKDSTGLAPEKSDTLKLSARSEESYGTVVLYFTNIDISKKPVVQFVQNSQVVKSVKLAGNEFRDKLFEPGEYSLRILYDENDNGVWDPGDYDLLRQPEEVLQIEKKLSVRKNWDNEITLTL